MGGRRGGEGRGGGVGREEAKAPQVNIRGPELPTGVNVSVMVLQGRKSYTLRKADHLSLATGDMVYG